VVKVLCYISERSLVRSQLVSLEFYIDIKSFQSHYGPGASNRNEYQKHFLGCKGGRCVRLTTLPPSCAVVTKSVNLNFLEPFGPLQACNRTDLPFACIYDVCLHNWILSLKFPLKPLPFKSSFAPGLLGVWPLLLLFRTQHSI